MIKNKIRIKENLAELEILSKNNEIIKTKIDLEDIEKIKKYRWCAIKHPNTNSFYIYASHHNINIKLHRYITDCPPNKVVDHINHDTLDNRKQNLRICTIAENNQNSGFYKTNKSGYKNICWHKKNKTWKIKINNKYLGCRKNIEDAILLRDNFRKELCNE